jgi:hypothetical protein
MYAHHYEIKEQKSDFLTVEPGEIPPEKFPSKRSRGVGLEVQ